MSWRSCAAVRPPTSRTTGAIRPSGVSTPMPTSIRDSSSRLCAVSSSQAFSPGSALHAAAIPRSSRVVTSCPAPQRCKSASSKIVQPATLSRARLMDCAMERRRPRSFSGSTAFVFGPAPIAASFAVAPLEMTPMLRCVDRVLRNAATLADGVVAATTSSTVIRPPRPVPFTRPRSIPRRFATARAAGAARTRPPEWLSPTR